MKLKMLLYCTKAKDRRDYLYKLLNGYFIGTGNIDGLNCLNGKIVAEFDGEVEKIFPINETVDDYDYGLLSGKDLLKGSCLSNGDIFEYLQDQNSGTDELFKKGYAIHIKNLNIFDKPKKISDFYKSTNEITFEPPLPLIKAPQNMCYAFDKDGNKYVVISVHPEWLCLILNGQKDIEIRRKVLKEMLCKS